MNIYSPHEIIRAFNRAAKHYDTAALLQRRIAETMLERMDFFKLNPKLILDIGAGTAHASRLLNKQFPKAKLISLDVAVNMLKIAKQKKKLFSKQHFICSDAAYLPFQDNSVDFIFSNLMLPWTLDIQETLQEWQRVLKPEGLLMFSTYGPDTLKELRQSWAEVDTSAHVHHFLDVHDVGNAVMTAGLANPVFDVEIFQVSFKNIRSLMLDLKTAGLHNLDPARQRGLTGKHKFKKMLRVYEDYKLQNQQYPASYEIIYGHAWGTAHKPAVTQAHPHPQIINIPLHSIKKS